MGTRNLTCVVKNGEYKVAQYGQFDGYPSGVGCDILEELLKPNSIKLLKENVDSLKIVTQEMIDKEIIAKAGSLELFKGMEVIKRNNIWEEINTLYPTPTREVAGKIINYIVNGYDDYISLYLSFAADSVFCEWAYVIDLDKNTFEVYSGFNKEPLTEEDRFFEFESLCENGYHPVKKVIEFNLDNLPSQSDFCDTIDKLVNEDDDKEIENNTPKEEMQLNLIIKKGDNLSPYVCKSSELLKELQLTLIEESKKNNCSISIIYNGNTIFLVDYSNI